ncbi:protein-tyrosine-phosphatase [Bradyrhizobium guangdongense]|nr:protein-tyrosine-phosphatase [Bradyrhizobium guangdongense]
MDPGSDVPTVFETFDAHQRLDLRFHDIIDPDSDMVVPNGEHIGELLRFGRAMYASKSSIKLLAHCHAGVSRSSAAATLMLAAAQPGAPAQAFSRLLAIAPNAWPNLRMIELGDALLGCNGQLVAAARAHYANMIERYPALRQMIAVDKHLRATRE